MKKCSKCGVEKPFQSFDKDKTKLDGFTSQCKTCRTSKRREWVERNRGNFSKVIIPQTSICSKCNKEKPSNSFFKDKEKTNGITSKCKECFKKYANENKSVAAKRSKGWYQKNKERIRPRRAELAKKRRKEDPSVKIREYVSRHMYRMLKNVNKVKDAEAWEILPYTPQQLKEHLESQFESWMSWKNYGKASIYKRTWNIDHIIPQSSFDFLSKKEIEKCWALKNLRPFEAIANIKKGNKVEEKRCND